MDNDTSLRRAQITLFALIAFGYLAVFFMRVSPAVMGPVMAEEMGLSAADLGLMASMYFWAQAAGCIPVGLVADRFSPSRLIAAALILTALGGAIFASASSVAGLALGRLLMGLVGACSFICGMKLFSSWFRPDQIATCSSSLLAVGNIGALLSTAPLMFLITSLGWRNSLWTATAYTLAAGLLCVLVLRDRPPSAANQPAVKAAPRSRAPIGASVRAIFKLRDFRLMTTAVSIYYGVFMNMGGLWSASYLHDVYGLDRGLASSVVLCFTAGVVFSSPICGFLSDKVFRARKKVFLTGVCAHAVTYIPLALFTDCLPSTAFIFVLFTLMGLTAGFNGIAYTCVKELVDLDKTATAVASTNMGVALGAAAVQYLCSLIINAYDKVNGVYETAAYAMAFRVCLGLLIVSVILALLFKERRTTE